MLSCDTMTPDDLKTFRKRHDLTQEGLVMVHWIVAGCHGSGLSCSRSSSKP